MLDETRMYEAAKAAVVDPVLADAPDLLDPTFKAHRDENGVRYAILTWQVEPPPHLGTRAPDLLHAVWRIGSDYAAVPVTDSRTRHRVLDACRFRHDAPGSATPTVRVRRGRRD